MQAIDIQDFEDMLEQAARRASKAWDIEFVGDMSDRYGEWGETMYVSDSQLAQLERIAGLA